ncbi:MAG: hypothetical protein A3D27_00105 [Omnitrophica WOR_2 bacterium RIFCSPHIGHO2_02_FULL_46_37]|nr:MAG: hypothetical protein A3D27_00105 [Omnitrophica WOR_2 bacterium RIFCSPHIGHO2_02_FULL_46_37]OGX43987.1 MAG: hypothetical protein A3H41_01885 [Omnitrophica WOR_2 bacterium RIFCSPLOWO2_02_FULL_45_28]
MMSFAPRQLAMEVDPLKLEPCPLSSKSNIEGFDCGDTDLNDFLLHDALSYQKQYLAQTTLLYIVDSLVIIRLPLTQSGLTLEKNQYFIRKSRFIAIRQSRLQEWPF